MRRYKFRSKWVLEADDARVFAEIQDVASWPQWWAAVKEVRVLESGGPNGVGSLYQYRWKAPILPYSLRLATYTRKVVPRTELEGLALGELEGRGLWTLTRAPGATVVQFNWDVATTRAWMNLLAPLIRPIFTRSHSKVMNQGAHALATRLGARLRSCDSTVEA